MEMQKKGRCGAIVLAAALAACGGNTDTTQVAMPMPQARLSAAPTAQAAAISYNTVVQQLYLAYFGRAADTSGLANFSAQLDALGAPSDIQGLVSAYGSNSTVRALIDSFGTSAESNALYTGDTTSFVTSIYKNVLNRAPDSSGLAFWVNAIDHGGLSKGNASLSIMAGALANTTTQGLVDAQIVSNKVTVATQFTAALNTSTRSSWYSGDAAAATVRGLLSMVTATTSAAAIPSSINYTLDTLEALSNSGDPAVSFSPAKVSLTYAAGSSVSFDVAATVRHPQNFSSGDLYIYVVDNVGVITNSLGLAQNGLTYTATLQSSSKIAAGTYKGNLAVKFCHDAACTSQFPGSPVALPYEFTVTAQ